MTTGKEYNSFLVKKHIILVGDFGAGKSSMLHNLIKKEFSSNFNTVSLDFHSYEIKHDEKTLKVFIWDSLGYERFQSITYNFYKKAQGVILVFDLTESDCVDAVQRWIETVKSSCKEGIPVLIVGNKSDICKSREAKLAEVSQSIPNDVNLISITTASAKTSENIEELFRSIILAMYDEKSDGNVSKSRISQRNSNSDGKIIQLSDRDNEQNDSVRMRDKKSCCSFL